MPTNKFLAKPLTLFFLVFGGPIIGGFLIHLQLIPDLSWEHEPIHAVIEILGSVVAFMLAYHLLVLFHREKELNSHFWFACALLGMGLFDGFHAICHPGRLFVWLHSLALIMGGLLAVMAWLPRRFALTAFASILPQAILLFTVSFSLLSMFFSDSLPVLRETGEFTLLAKTLNTAGGLLFTLAALKFAIDYKNHARTADLLFSCFTLLLGVSGLIFQHAEVWDIHWWFMHILRFFAYIIAFYYILKIYLQRQEEVIELNEALQKRTVELKRASDDLHRLIYVSYHDLQEPLRMVSSYVQLLERRYCQQFDEDGQQFIKFAVDGALLMKNRLNDLLSFSQISSQSVLFKTIDFQKVFDSALVNLQKKIDECQAQISHDVLPAIQGDEGRLVQFLQHLLDNAMTFHGERSPIVHISVKEAGGFWTFKVADNGIGIDEKHFSRIFEIFRKLQSSSELQGTGIGLTICKKIIEQHGGEIWLESSPGEGATFFFTLLKGDTRK